MDVVEDLNGRNKVFAAASFTPGLTMLPSMKTLIIACVDPRVDPYEVLGLASGEVAVIRNIGGRIDPATLLTMALLRTVARVQGNEIGPGWHWIVLHHTDCGITHCHTHAPEFLAKHLGVAQDDLEGLSISDPYAAVAKDVAALKANPKVPAGVLVTGLVYDVANGRVETVVPTAPLGSPK